MMYACNNYYNTTKGLLHSEKLNMFIIKFVTTLPALPNLNNNLLLHA